MQPKVVVVGSCNIDLVARTTRLPRPGETVLARSLDVIVGGKGANQAIAAARAGARCAMIGAVGDDPYAERIRAALRESAVAIDRLRTVSGPSGMALISVDATGENSIVVIAGANGHLALAEEDHAVVDEAAAVIVQLEIPVETVIAAASRARGIRILNAAPARALPAELWPTIDVLVVNEDEAMTLAPTAVGVDSAIERLVELVPRVALTLGAKGVRYAERSGGRITVSPPSARVVDATAAGDAFTGMLATALAEGRPAREALELACAAGSLCVERAGASTAIPYRAEIDGRWAAAYRDVASAT
ncbi:MAG TPA: ribokinase [Candidatus Acidoferrales bacterium]|nr:ribokinase [Candidatus Acidoferrales bacterium]